MRNVLHRIGDALEAFRGKTAPSARNRVVISAGESKMDPTGAITVQQKLNQQQRMPLDYAGFAKEGLGQCVVAKRAIEIVSHAVAGIPLVLQTRQGGKWVTAETGDDHPAMVLLNRPNPQASYEDYMEAFCGYDQLSGNAYVVGNNQIAFGDASAPPEELWFMRPDRVSAFPSKFGGIGQYVYTVDSREQKFNVDVVGGRSPVLHWKRWHPMNDFFGLSPMRAAAMQIDQFNAGGQWNMNVLHNSGRPAGAFVYAPEGATGATLGRDARETLESEIDNKILKPENARRPLILDAGLDWKEMGMNAVDLDWLEGLRDASRWIALAYGVPSMLLGIPGDNTYANYEQARLALYEDTAIPYLKRILGAHNRWLMPAFGDPTNTRLWFDLKDVHALSLRRKETFDTVNAASYMTTNEKRIAVGLEPLEDGEGGDEILVPSTMVPLSQQSLAPGEDGSRMADPNAPPEPADSAAPGKKPKGKLNGKKTFIPELDRYKAIDAIFERIK